MPSKCPLPVSKKLKYRLLALDIDGTLVNSRDELTPDTIAALLRAGGAGIHVVLATGRRYSRTLHFVEALGLDVPLITATGALVKDPKDHRTLYKSVFDSQLLRRVVSLIESNGFDAVLCADTFSEGFDFYHARPEARNSELAEYLELNPDDGRVWPDLISNPPPDAFLCFTMGTKEQMRALDKILHGELQGLISTHVLRSPRYSGFLVEIAPAGVSKWSAVLRMADAWGIGKESICAVGDDVNDIPMIREAGLGVAMGNALPEVIAAADRVAPTHDENGLVQVVQWLLE
jgi:5-amino-6-(5-phospho-D-ribitylamino)uracil phosphatase